MDLGFWGLDLEICKKQMRKKEKQPRKQKVHCLQGVNPVLPQGEGPLRGNSRNFFLGAFWDVMGNPMKGIDNDNDKTTKTTCFLGTVSFLLEG